MNVSILITCFNEEKNIRECLTSIVKQNYTGGESEIIVSDGGSNDGTQAIVQAFSKSYPNVRLVIETKKGTAAGRNAAIKAARYDYVAFIDADCEAPENWLETLVKQYQTIHAKDQRVIAVGGTNVPPEDANPFLQAIGIALDSFPGSFNSIQGRQLGELTYVSSLSNLNVLYSKREIREVGYYDESLVSEAEDADINFRLSSKGYKFVFLPDSSVRHKMRPTPKTWMKNMFRYGKGRARLLKRYPRMWSLTFVFPLLFALIMFSLVLAPFHKVFYLAALYFPLLYLFSLFQSIRKRSLTLVFHVMFVFLIQHFGYASGEVFGLLHPQVK